MQVQWQHWHLQAQYLPHGQWRQWHFLILAEGGRFQHHCFQWVDSQSLKLMDPQNNGFSILKWSLISDDDLELYSSLPPILGNFQLVVFTEI